MNEDESCKDNFRYRATPLNLATVLYFLLVLAFIIVRFEDLAGGFGFGVLAILFLLGLAIPALLIDAFIQMLVTSLKWLYIVEFPLIIVWITLMYIYLWPLTA